MTTGTVPPRAKVSMVRTFVTAATTKNNYHQIQQQQLDTTKNQIIALSTRCHSSSNSSSTPPRTIPPTPKLILPSNLVIDPRSRFFNMFDNTATTPNRTKEETQMNTAAAAVSEEEEEEEEEVGDEPWYDENDDDGDDELFDDEGAVRPYREGVVYTKPLPERLHVEIHSLFRSPSLVGSIHLNESIFGLDPIRVDLLKRAVDYYRAKKRGKRTAKTKTISEVSGSGRKVRKQKGGGVARAGHSRPPHWRGGAKAHGPKNTTDYGDTKLNKKVRQLATRHVLSQKLKEGNLILLNHMHELPTHKTNDLVRILAEWKIGGLNGGSSALILDHYHNPSDEQLPLSHAGIPTNLHVASRNIPGVLAAHCSGANVYDILKYEKLVITLAAMEQIEERLKMY